MITSLASLLAPASAEDVVSALTSRRHLFVRAPDPRRLADLLPWRVINTLFFANRFAPGQIRVTQASTEAPPSIAMVQSALAGASLDDVLDAAALLAHKGLVFVGTDDTPGEH